MPKIPVNGRPERRNSLASLDMALHKILDKLRRDKGVSVREVARRIDASPSTVATYFSGRSVPDFETAVALADYFGVSLDAMGGRAVPSDTLSIAEMMILDEAKRIGYMEAMRRLRGGAGADGTARREEETVVVTPVVIYDDQGKPHTAPNPGPAPRRREV